MSMAAPIGPYTPIVRVGEWLICSGQLGLKDGALVDGGVQAQARQALANVAALLGSEGAGLERRGEDHRVPDRHRRLRADQRGLRRGLRRPPPGPLGVAVAGLPLGALVEIEAWARAAL